MNFNDKDKIIKNNNDKINSIIKEIIKENPEDTFITNSDGTHDLSDTYKEMISLEIKKILKIYHLEFPNLPYDKDRNIGLKVYDGSHADAKYKDGMVQFSYGTKNEMEKIKNKEMKYSIDEKGQIHFDDNGTTDKIECNLIEGDDGLPYIISKNERVENSLNHNLENLYYNINNSNYAECLFNVLPHELMHSIGFGSGIFEGVTENNARELSNKYNLNNNGIARQDEVKLIQKIEKIIGRDSLVSLCNKFEGNEENIDGISKLLDEKLSIGKENYKTGMLNNYIELSKKFNNALSDRESIFIEQNPNYTELSRNEIEEAFKKIDDYLNLDVNQLNQDARNSFRTLIIELDDYILDPNNKLYELGQTSIKRNNKDFDDVISFQESELLKLEQILNKVKEKQNEEKEQANLDEFRNSLSTLVNNGKIPYNTRNYEESISNQSNDTPSTDEDISL